MDFALLVLSAALGALFLGLFAFLGGKLRSREARDGVLCVSDLPGPPAKFLVGNLPELTRKGTHICQLEWMQEYGDMYRYKMGPATVVVVTHPTLIREFTMLQFKAFHDRPTPPTMAPTSEKGLLFSKGRYWAGLRSALTPPFQNDSHVAALYPHMVPCTEALLARVHAQCHAQRSGRCQLDIQALLEEATLDTIGMTCFGAEQWHQDLEVPVLEAGPQNPSRLKPATVYSILEQLASRTGVLTQLALLACPSALRPHLRRLLASIPGLNIARAQQMRDALSREWLEQLAARRKRLGAEGAVAKDLVVHLMRAKVKGTETALSDADMTAALFNLIGAATGTSASTVACALFYLAKHPAAQDRARAEARAALLGGGDQGRGRMDLGQEALGKLPFNEAVLKETLRLASPGGLVGRAASQDTVLGNCFLPKGTPVLAPIYAVHRSPAFFPRALEFLPERFLGHGKKGEGSASSSVGTNEEGAHALWGSLSEAAYFPFGLGPRMCIGQKYAMLEVKLLLATILCEFTVELVAQGQELKLKPGITLRPQNGVNLIFAPA